MILLEKVRKHFIGKVKNMYELIQVNKNDYYIDCPAKIGVIKVSDNEVICVDSGSDKDAGKKVLKKINENGWKLKAVYNTHSHADHIGGNKYLQDQTACKIFARGIEKNFTNHPILEAALLYGGFPPEELKHKFLYAQESVADEMPLESLEKGIEILPLPGHSFDMVGFITPDKTAYIADCLSSKETIEKYGIGYLWNVEAYIATLEKIKTLEAEKFIPSHAAVTDDIKPLAQYNIDTVISVGERLAALLNEPMCFDNLLKKAFIEFNMIMSPQQHALIGSTVKSYLSWLKKNGKVESLIEDNMLLWKKL